MSDPIDSTTIVDVTDVDPALDTFTCLVTAESRLREAQRDRVLGNDLTEFERNYFGPEVGAVRRAYNRTMMKHMQTGGRLLDFGCGGVWWKQDYWPSFSEVTACEVDRSALKEIGAAYPAVRLWWTRNGLIGTEESFDVVLSSSVLGYILPEQARHHIACAYRLLGEGGQLVLTRVLAYDLAAWLRGRRLVDLPGPRFAYHYSKAELVRVLRDVGFRDIRYHTLGARLPGLSWRINQALYKAAPPLMTQAFPAMFPFFKVQHMLTARK